MMKVISQLGKNKLEGKKVLLRVDFNIPVVKEEIAETFRVKAAKETINYLLESGAKVVLVSHIEAIGGFDPIVERVGEILGQTLTLVPLSEMRTLDNLFNASQILLLDNIRQDRREVENDKRFAQELAGRFDFYINDAFAVCHRKHASVSAITEFLPSYAGFLVKKETEKLSEAIKAPAAGKIVVLGGAKISTKLPVIKNFLGPEGVRPVGPYGAGKAEKILIGGALANNFFRFDGLEVGQSMVDEDSLPLLAELKKGGFWNSKIVLPEDILISQDKTGRLGAEPYPAKNIDPFHLILDVGPETARHFADIVRAGKMVIWNGPMGFCEVNAFAEGTRVVAEAVASVKYSVIGGGDTIAAADKLGLLDRFGFVSTGGGAMLEFLAGNKLPGLRALGYY